jgi:hypothetical protein
VRVRGDHRHEALVDQAPRGGPGILAVFAGQRLRVDLRQGIRPLARGAALPTRRAWRRRCARDGRPVRQSRARAAPPWRLGSRLQSPRRGPLPVASGRLTVPARAVAAHTGSANLRRRGPARRRSGSRAARSRRPDALAARRLGDGPPRRRPSPDRTESAVSRRRPPYRPPRRHVRAPGCRGGSAGPSSTPGGDGSEGRLRASISSFGSRRAQAVTSL